MNGPRLVRVLIVSCAVTLLPAVTGCGAGAPQPSVGEGHVDGTYTGSITAGGANIPLSFRVRGSGTTVQGLVMNAPPDRCSEGSWPAGSMDLPQLAVGSDHTFRAHADGDDLQDPGGLGGDRSVDLLGHLDGHGFAQGAVRLAAGSCGFEGTWTATDAGATATLPRVSDGDYVGHNIVFHRDSISSPDNHPEVTFSLASGGRRAVSIVAGVFSECAGEGAYRLRRFPDTDVDVTGEFTTTTDPGLTLVGHLDSDGVAVGSIRTPSPAGRCNDDGSIWEAQRR